LFLLHVVAPEIFDCAADECEGYGFPVDWWSLGIVAYEMFFGARPFDIHSTTSVSEVRALFPAGAVYPRSSRASRGFVDLIDRVSLFSQSYITYCVYENLHRTLRSTESNMYFHMSFLISILLLPCHVTYISLVRSLLP